jgi:hypothetical protein
MKNILIAAVVLLTGLAGYAQKTTVSASIVAATEITSPSRLDFNVGVATSHLWRGLVINDGMTAMGFVHLALDENQNFTTGVWGGAGFDGDYREINYYVQYQKNNLSIALWNLFNTTGIETPMVFNYDKLTTTHIIDLRTSYRFPKAFPLRIEADVFLYTGKNDRELDFNNNYNSRYSTYVELSYPVVENQKVNASLYIGGVFALDGSSNLYRADQSKDFGIVNTGFRLTKDISVLNYKLPVSATAMWNPANKIARLQLAVSLF